MNYKLLNYSINVLVEKIMKKYGGSYDSSLNIVLNSDFYKELIKKDFLLEEGDLYLFELLDKEISGKVEVAI